MPSPGQRLRTALADPPLQVVGAVNAYSALLAEHAGHRALYLSGAGVANSAFGLPDLGLTNLSELVEECRRITAVTDLPLLVDIDTGGADPLLIARTIAALERAGAAGVQIEDQPLQKRCGHRQGKGLVRAEEMVERLSAAVDARSDPDFVLVARTDAYAWEGLAGVLARCQRYVEAGADLLFPEALAELNEYRDLAAATSAPILANITEFGRTPLFSCDELHQVGVAAVLYPLTAFRAQSEAAWNVYCRLKADGHQRDLIDRLQTRDALYRHLDYARFEQAQDAVLARLKEQNDERE